jgi:hypothetical protein
VSYLDLGYYRNKEVEDYGLLIDTKQISAKRSTGTPCPNTKFSKIAGRFSKDGYYYAMVIHMCDPKRNNLTDLNALNIKATISATLTVNVGVNSKTLFLEHSTALFNGEADSVSIFETYYYVNDSDSGRIWDLKYSLNGRQFNDMDYPKFLDIKTSVPKPVELLTSFNTPADPAMVETFELRYNSTFIAASSGSQWTDVTFGSFIDVIDDVHDPKSKVVELTEFYCGFTESGKIQNINSNQLDHSGMKISVINAGSGIMLGFIALTASVVFLALLYGVTFASMCIR